MLHESTILRPAHQDPEIQAILLACMNSTRITGITLFPELFYTDFCDIHDIIFDLIDSGKQKIAIAAPRGIGKTTIARTVAARFALFRLTKFICYVMNSATVAGMQTENLKRDLLGTPAVRQFFGNIKEDISNDTGMEEFSKLAWTTFGDTLVLPRGSGQQVRGLNWSNSRPGLIIVDDLEKVKEIQSVENRTALKKWFHSDLMKSVDRYAGDWVIIYIDTLKHEDSLLAELLDDPDWASVELALAEVDLDDDGEVLDIRSLVPTYMSNAELKVEFDAHVRRGDLDTFYSEYMNKPTSQADISFNKNHFKSYSEEAPEFFEISRNLLNIVIVDPAKTVKMQSADSAVVVLGIDNDNCRYYVRAVFSGKVFPDQLYDVIFDYAAQFDPVAVGIEVTSLNQFIVQPIQNEMAVRGQGFDLVELNAVGKKEDRIAKLVPYYRHGYIYHALGQCDKLEEQLKGFPKSKLWDIMDALGYLPKMLAIGEHTFTPNFDEDDPEAEFAELEASYEPALSSEWRLI